ncbi:MAG: histidinol dehydrogenase [Chloroflexi bacterium]|nr:histidinol dehydrogenase [Chloroflexota bacterium]
MDAIRARLTRGLLSDPAKGDALAEGIAKLFGEPLTPEQAVDRIIADVAASGDAALRRYTKALDGAEDYSIVVPKEEIDEALESIDPGLREALEEAADRVRSFHQACLPVGWFDQATGLGQAIHPLESVGIYIPGGTASYPSTVLHTVIPARVANVKRVAIASPPQRDGATSPVVLAAARIAGAQEVYRVGGAQAIAALALGTETIPKVDKVFGPGNIFVTLAKRKLYGQVGIDGLYGPTETMIIADESANPVLCAADLLAQAEHDPLAIPILITNSLSLAQAAAKQVECQLRHLERRDVANASLANQGAIGVVDTLDQAIVLANEFAPEHLSLLVADPQTMASQVTRTGGIFLGEASPEVLGDYNAGPSHVMPTGGAARFASALGLHDFVRVTSLIGLNPSQAKGLYATAARIARAEGLTAHARAAELRLERGNQESATP